MSAFFPGRGCTGLRARRSTEPSEIAFDLAVEIMSHVAMAIRLAHVAAQPGLRRAPRGGAQLGYRVRQEERHTQHGGKPKWRKSRRAVENSDPADWIAAHRQGGRHHDSESLLAGIQRV